MLKTILPLLPRAAIINNARVTTMDAPVSQRVQSSWHETKVCFEVQHCCLVLALMQWAADKRQKAFHLTSLNKYIIQCTVQSLLAYASHPARIPRMTVI